MEVREETQKPPPEKWGRVFWACGGAMMIFLFLGIIEAQSAVLLPRLQEPDSPIQVTKDQETWIASLGIFASPVSSILCGPFVDYFGRKVALQVFYLTCALSFAIIAAATSVVHLYIGRILCSLAVGFEIAGIVYMAEVCTKTQRSLCMSLSYSIFTGGILFTYVVALALPWNVGSALYALLCLLMVLYQWFTPESPPWLVKKGQTDRAVTELRRLGRNEADISEEMDVLQRSCHEETSQKIDWRTFLHPTVWKPFLVISLFHFLQACTGTWNLLYYTVDFINELGTEYDAYTVSTGLAIGRFLMTSTVGSYFMAKIRRKTSTAVSGFAMGVTLLVAAVYEYQYDVTPPSQRPNTWIPILAVFASVLVSCTGVLHLPWVMSGEVFPLHVRGAMGGAVFFVGTVSMFLCLKFYVFFIETLAITGTLLLFAIASFAIGVFGVCILTETQNKSLQEVEESYRKKKKSVYIIDVEKTGL